jgi:hypothetical protein
MSRQGWCEERGARGLAGAQAGCNVGSGISFASFRRFWAVAARRNSSRAIAAMRESSNILTDALPMMPMPGEGLAAFPVCATGAREVWVSPNTQT